MRTAPLFFFLLVIMACNSIADRKPSAENKPVAAKRSVIVLSMIDSINQYKEAINLVGADTSGKGLFAILEANGRKIALIHLADTAVLLFKQEANKWEQTDSITINEFLINFLVTDMNGDHIDDIVLYASPTSHGHMLNYLLLGKKNGGYRFLPNVKLFNMKYDANLKMVRSYYDGTNFGQNTKELYQWLGDSLQLYRGVEQDLSDHQHIITAFYHHEKGELIVDKKVPDPKGKYYDTALWKGTYYPEEDLFPN